MNTSSLKAEVNVFVNANGPIIAGNLHANKKYSHGWDKDCLLTRESEMLPLIHGGLQQGEFTFSETMKKAMLGFNFTLLQQKRCSFFDLVRSTGLRPLRRTTTFLNVGMANQVLGSLKATGRWQILGILDRELYTQYQFPNESNGYLVRITKGMTVDA